MHICRYLFVLNLGVQLTTEGFASKIFLAPSVHRAWITKENHMHGKVISLLKNPYVKIVKYHLILFHFCAKKTRNAVISVFFHLRHARSE